MGPGVCRFMVVSLATGSLMVGTELTITIRDVNGACFMTLCSARSPQRMMAEFIATTKSPKVVGWIYQGGGGTRKSL